MSSAPTEWVVSRSVSQVTFVSHQNLVSAPTEWDMSHSLSHVNFESLHNFIFCAHWMSHVTECESCHIWVTSPWHRFYLSAHWMSHVTHMNHVTSESCHNISATEWVTSLNESHITQCESCYIWVMSHFSHVPMSSAPTEWVMSHSVNHVTSESCHISVTFLGLQHLLNESCHTVWIMLHPSHVTISYQTHWMCHVT